jgi:hypothetical protein
MQDVTVGTYATRLGAAVQRWGGPRAVAAFSRTMQERGVRGATRESVHQALRGRREPSLAFVEAAADVLGVTPGWLAFGIGPATVQEQAAVTALLQWGFEGGRVIDALTEARAQSGELDLNGGDHA